MNFYELFYSAQYEYTYWIFLRALGVIFLIAYASFGRQVIGLIGAEGILPVHEYLDAIRTQYGRQGYLLAPTIFWLNASNRALRLVCLAGIIGSTLLILDTGPTKILLLLLIVGYLSLVTAGQVFMSFQWDALLIETGFTALLLGPSIISVWLLRWLLFRLMFLSGILKLQSGDPTWRNLTALCYHYETQPLPNPVAWYVHKLPSWFHKFSVAVMFFIELVVPFFIFGPIELRIFAAGAFVFLQVLIFITGNYNFFNLLTMVLCIPLLDDTAVSTWLPPQLIPFIAGQAGTPRPVSPTEQILLLVLALLILVLSLSMMIERLVGKGVPERIRQMLGWIAIFRVINFYGLFAVMTTTRPEIIIEGSHDGETWQPYEFKYKPGALQRRPPWVAPHQPRLDWQMWFAALERYYYYSHPWFTRFILRLLEGAPDVLQLLDTNPFPDAPPRYIRALFYKYRFTDWETRRTTGAWWQRELLGYYLAPVALPEA